MRAHVKRWGRALAVRIPKSLAVQLGLEQDSSVDLSVVKGKLIISPTVTAQPTLKQLLAKVTEQNRHHEVEAGLLSETSCGDRGEIAFLHFGVRDSTVSACSCVFVIRPVE